ncbi:glycosyltransferase [Herbidospora mongoliensis]|uniref:glycosyltransferase n=1 Tax=Herbidospora mongoliensis TaxID=688067 RepID=UPI000836CB5A|nr:glycosyltransferase [Herbidospora mongoliensis]
MNTVAFACMDADTLGGIQRVSHTLAQGLARRGYDVHVIGLHRSADPVDYIEDPAYGRHEINPGPRWRWGAKKRAHTLLDAIPPGLLVMTSPGVVTRLSGLLGGHRGIGQYHGSFAHARGTWHFGSVRALYGSLDQAVFLSEDDAWRFAEEALLPNTWHIPNPLPGWPHRVSPLTGKRVLGVGRLAGVKRFDRLISAFARAARPDWELHLIGDGPDADRLMLHAVTEGVSQQVTFRGRIPAGEMPAEYRAASLVALSSEHEGLPLVLGEAAAFGLPTVAFDVSGGVRALIDDNRTGVLVPPGDVPALAAALGDLMDDEPRRAAMGEAAREHASAFRLEPILDRWEHLFAHLSR